MFPCDGMDGLTSYVVSAGADEHEMGHVSTSCR